MYQVSETRFERIVLMSEKKSLPVFTVEFKADAVELVLTSKESVSAVARQLDVSDGALRRWVKDFKLEHPEHDDGVPGPVDWQKYKAALRGSW